MALYIKSATAAQELNKKKNSQKAPAVEAYIAKHGELVGYSSAAEAYIATHGDLVGYNPGIKPTTERNLIRLICINRRDADASLARGQFQEYAKASRAVERFQELLERLPPVATPTRRVREPEPPWYVKLFQERLQRSEDDIGAVVQTSAQPSRT